MGLAEKEFIDCYREMMAERHGAKLSPTEIAILAAACVINRTLKKSEEGEATQRDFGGRP